MKSTSALQITIPTSREITMTRVFDAPRHLVFEALTKPELVKQWLLGPPGWTMPVCEIDLRVGGAYRYVWRKESVGKEMGLRGVFREIVPPERLVFTEVFDDAWWMQDGARHPTWSLAATIGRRSRLTLTGKVDFSSFRLRGWSQ